MSKEAKEQNLTPTMQLQEIVARMEQMRAELDSLKGRTYAHVQTNNQALPQPTSQAKSEVSTTRRNLLRRLAGGLVAGLAVGGIGASLPQNAEAKISSNPATNGLGSRAGMLVVPPGTSVINNLNGGSTKVGLVVSSDNPTFDISVFTPTVNAAILASTSGNGSAIVGQTVSGTGVYGQSNTNIGVSGKTNGATGIGVYGENTTNSTGNSDAVYGLSTKGRGVHGKSTDGFGVDGESTNNYGVYGSSSSSYGVGGFSIDSHGVYGKSTNGIGVYGTGGIQGIYGTGSTYGVSGYSSNYGVYGDGGTCGVRGDGTSFGVYGYCSSGSGVRGSSGSGYGIFGSGDTGVRGEGDNQGVYGYSRTGLGVSGVGKTGIDGQGFPDGSGNLTSYGVYGVGYYGVYGYGSPYAGYFFGNVGISGSISKGGGSFKIDHPLDPANKYLYHSFVESPDMKNIYDGVVTLNEKGEATVEMPDWFDVLNSDFRYQLTCLDQYAPVYIADRLKERKFKIAGGKSGQEVSWMVTGIRQDEWAKVHRIPVEEDKVKDEKGKYLHPELFGQPEEMLVHRRPNKVER